MGLLSKLFKDEEFDSDYLEMCNLCEEWNELYKNSADIKKQNEVAEQYLKISEKLFYSKKDKLIQRVLQESETDNLGFIYTHPKLGTFFKSFREGESFLDNYIENIKKTIESRTTDYQKLEEFKKLPDQLEEVFIECNEEATPKRQSVEDMPEIKLSPIGRHFDKLGKLATYVVVDVETTGLSATEDRIIQLSAIKVIEGKIMSYFSTYVNPEMNIPESATEVNGITDDMVLSSPKIEQIADTFLRYVGNNPVVGYNVSFDVKFLFTSGIDLITKRRLYDVYQLVKTVYRNGPPSYKLETICWYLGIKYPAHNSLYDCIATGMVFERAVYERINS